MIRAYRIKDPKTGYQFNLIVRGRFGYAFPPIDNPEGIYQQVVQVFWNADRLKRKYKYLQLERQAIKRGLQVWTLKYHKECEPDFDWEELKDD